jgi:hypothetical protein
MQTNCKVYNSAAYFKISSKKKRKKKGDKYEHTNARVRTHITIMCISVTYLEIFVESGDKDGDVCVRVCAAAECKIVGGCVDGDAMRQCALPTNILLKHVSKCVCVLCA